MKTNFRLSAKMHLFIIISSVIIAVGLIVGLVCEFAANGYFNYGNDWASYKSITFTYKTAEFDEDEAKDTCKTAFKSAGVSYYEVTSGDGVLTYKFVLSTKDDKLSAAVETINSSIKTSTDKYGDVVLSNVALYNGKTLLGGGKAFARCAIAISSVVVFGFAYFVIRYKLTMALASLLANVHNLALFISLLALTRIPVGPSVLAFAVLTVLLTTIGCAFTFDRMRKDLKNEDLKKLTTFERVDKGANESFKLNVLVPACLACVTAVMFVLLSISSLSPLAIMAPVFAALVSFVSCAYGTALFTPSVYSRFALLGDNYKSTHQRAPKKKTSK